MVIFLGVKSVVPFSTLKLRKNKTNLACLYAFTHAYFSAHLYGLIQKNIKTTRGMKIKISIQLLVLTFTIQELDFESNASQFVIRIGETSSTP